MRYRASESGYTTRRQHQGEARPIRHAVAVVVAAASLALAGSALAAPGNPPPPDSTTQPLKDGCQRSAAALLAGTSPEWVYVYNTPPDQAAPKPQWASGIASSYNPAFQAVHTAGGDNPAGHDAYDFNVNIAVDPQYSFLLGGSAASGTGNYAGNGEETQRLHTEWEDLTIPKFAWPEPGDRVTQRGSWVWDCGHWGTPTNPFSPDYWLPKEGQPCPGLVAPDPSQCMITGERTEFHPYRAIWDQRAQPPNSPYGASEAELFISTEKTEAGKEADCAHRYPPPPGQATYGPDYQACVASEPNWQDVSGHYSFFLPAPPKPSPDATLVYRAVNHGSVGAPKPKLTPTADGLQVTFGLSSAAGQRVIMGYSFFVGWSPVPAATVPTHLRVTFDQLVVHRAMDPGCSGGASVPDCQYESTNQNQSSTAPGDWNLYWDVNGIWGQWAPGDGEFLTEDGDTLSGGQSVDLYVPPGNGWRLYVHGRECDLNALDPARAPFADCPTNREAASDNDVQGQIVDAYPSADASVGTHTSNAQTAGTDLTSTCPSANPSGCYTLTYTVSKVDDAAARTGPVPPGGP